jgi:hypothetical protein
MLGQTAGDLGRQVGETREICQFSVKFVTVTKFGSFQIGYRALFDPPESDAMSFPRKPGNIITLILFAIIQRRC